MTTTGKGLPVKIASTLGDGLIRVLVLHGWTMDSSVWRPVHDLFDRTKFQYAFLDFPGYGVQINEPPAPDMDAMAAAALEAANGLGWEQFAILGHSMGGGAALRLATLVPERITSVVAVTPVSPAGTPLDAETYAAFEGMWADCESALKNVGPHLSESQLRMMAAAARETMTRGTWEAYLRNWTSSDFAASLKNYEGPAALIIGKSDPLVTAAYLEPALNALKGARLETVAEAGHYPMLEQSAETVNLCERALR